MLEWCIGIATALLALLVYFAYFFKFNWVKVSVDQVILPDLSSVLLLRCSEIYNLAFLKGFEK